MANDELIALLKNLQGSGAGGVLNSGLLAQLPPLIAAAVEPEPAGGGESRGSVIASAASTAASAALRTVGGGLTLLPVVSSLLKLFGVGGEKEALPPLERFALPPPIRAEAGLSQSGETFLIDRSVGDRIRQLPAPSGTTRFAGAQTALASDGSTRFGGAPAAWPSPGEVLLGGSQTAWPLPGETQFGSTQVTSAPPGTTQSGGTRGASAPPGAGTAITVNVQAMDSQSFMDRREDIARAVREAMLQSHSLNDVVSEL